MQWPADALGGAPFHQKQPACYQLHQLDHDFLTWESIQEEDNCINKKSDLLLQLRECFTFLYLRHLVHLSIYCICNTQVQSWWMRIFFNDAWVPLVKILSSSSSNTDATYLHNVAIAFHFKSFVPYGFIRCILRSLWNIEVLLTSYGVLKSRNSDFGVVCVQRSLE